MSVQKIPPAPFSRGSNQAFGKSLSKRGVRPYLPTLLMLLGKIQHAKGLNSPLKRGLGGFSELIFGMGKLFNSRS